MRWAGHVAHVGERRVAYRSLAGKPWGKTPLGGPRRRWNDDIKMDLQKVRWKAWTGLIWLRIGTGGDLLKAVMNICVPQNAETFLTILKPVSLSRRTRTMQ
jgi:hypothetical protein